MCPGSNVKCPNAKTALPPCDPNALYIEGIMIPVLFTVWHQDGRDIMSRKSYNLILSLPKCRYLRSALASRAGRGGHSSVLPELLDRARGDGQHQARPKQDYWFRCYRLSPPKTVKAALGEEGREPLQRDAATDDARRSRKALFLSLANRLT